MYVQFMNSIAKFSSVAPGNVIDLPNTNGGEVA